ncbi:YIPF6-like protein, partial [Mya arenaria]
DLNEVSLEGDITVPGLQTTDDELSTLDEPVKDTIMRDLKAVGVKFSHVLYPKTSTALLREWDLWGPLILCVFMAMMLQSGSDDLDKPGEGGPQFAEVFFIYWVGAVVVTFNTKLLGGNISFFQSVCVLGYCVCPLAIALVVCRCILIIDEQTTPLFIVRFVAVVVGFAWSTFASTAFLAESQPPNRKALAMYPIFFFYFVISWLIISHTHS